MAANNNNHNHHHDNNNNYNNGYIGETSYNRREWLEMFDSAKTGVKVLAESGQTEIPPAFHHPLEIVNDLDESDDDNNIIPIIDLELPHDELVEKIREASANLGYFQIINHGVPVALADQLLTAMMDFYNQPPAEKEVLYGRDGPTYSKPVCFYTNIDLFYSTAACWRDTLHIQLRPQLAESIPLVCKDEVTNWDREVSPLGNRIVSLLSEGLGLSHDQLEGPAYTGRVGLYAEFYPRCPEPLKTLGFQAHTDPQLMVILLPDDKGGLQVRYNDKWLNLRPLRGALVVFIGDLLQILSNDEYQSGIFRVKANPDPETRASVAVTFFPYFTP